jgi:hypothetical protein
MKGKTCNPKTASASEGYKQGRESDEEVAIAL